MNLKRPIYEKTAENGHFGNDEFPWEQPKSLRLTTEVLDKVKTMKAEGKKHMTSASSANSLAR